MSGEIGIHLGGLAALGEVAGGVELELELAGHFGFVEERRELAELALGFGEIDISFDVMLGEGFAGAVDRREAAGEADDEVANVGDCPPTAETCGVNREMNGFGGDGFASTGAAEVPSLLAAKS